MGILVGLVGLLGCAPPITSLCPSSTVTRSIRVESADRVDLLFVIDGSASMEEEQDALARELPRWIRALGTGDANEDGTPDFHALRSMHLGVISSDLGGGGGAGCDGVGDGGVLRDEGRPPSCMPTYPARVFRFGFEPSVDPTVLAAEVGCVADLGTSRCGVEQPLEAMLLALSPAAPNDTVASTFVPVAFEGGPGRGDGENAGFLRADSILSVVVITDEDDCSHRGTLPSSDALDPGCAGLDVLPIDRYVTGLLQLRESPSQLVFAAIAGIPEDLADATYEAMASDPRLSSADAPSCASPTGRATPPLRLIELALALRDRGATTSVGSICDGTWPLEGLLAPTRAAPGPAQLCLPRALDLDADGHPPCEVVILLSPESERVSETRCEASGFLLLASELDPITGRARERCLVPDLGPEWASSLEPGWAYDDTSAVGVSCSQRLVFPGLDHFTDVEVTIRCQQPLPDGTPYAPECEGSF